MALASFLGIVWPMWLIILGVLLFLNIPFVTRIFKAVPVNKRLLIWILIGVGLFYGGYLGSLGLASLAPATTVAGVGSAVAIDDIAITYTDTWNDTASTHCSVGTDTTVDDTIYIRCFDVGVSETAIQYELNFTTVVKRADASIAGSCEVKADVVEFLASNTSYDATDNTYSIVEKNSLGELEVYLDEDGTVTTSDAVESAVLPFAEGTQEATLSGIVEIDEEASDAIFVYETKTITLTFCDGKKLWIDFMKL